MSVHSSVLEIYFLFSSVMLGCTAATCIRTGFHLGKGSVDNAKQYVQQHMPAAYFTQVYL